MYILSFIEDYWDALLSMTAEMAPYLLLGFFFAGLLRAFVPKNIYRRHLAPRNMKSVVKAALLGIPLPLCSCGVIPTSVGLRREGASHGACTSFLIATPQTGVDSIAATYSLMGLPFAVVRPIAALFTAMFGGWLVNRYARDDEKLSAEQANHDENSQCDCGHHHDHDHDHDHSDHDHCHSDHHHEAADGEDWWHRFADAMRYAFVEMLQDVGKWLVVGLLIAALITVAVPNEWLAALHDYKLLNMIIVLAVAIPMYVCATGSIPIAVSLMAKGLTPGAALVLLMAGPAVNSASMLVIGKVFGRRTLWLYVASIVVGAMLFGLGIDYLLPQEWFRVDSVMAGGEHCAHCLGVWDWIWIGILAVLMVNAFSRQLHSSLSLRHRHNDHAGHDHHDGGGTAHVSQYKVTGMTCNHCRMGVERAIGGVAGVEQVSVDLATGTAYVTGAHDPSALAAAVEAIGFEVAPADTPVQR